MIKIPAWLLLYVAVSFVVAILVSLVLGDDSIVPTMIIVMSVLVGRHLWRYAQSERQDAQSIDSERWIKGLVRSNPLPEVVRRLNTDPEAAGHLAALDPSRRELLLQYLSTKRNLDDGKVPEPAQEDARLAIEMYEAENWSPDLVERLEAAQRRRQR